MPQYTVANPGGGFTTVTASDPDAARVNAGAAPGATVIAGGNAAHQEGGQAVGGYAPGYNAGGQIGTQNAQTTTTGQGAQQYGDAVQRALDALASGNREAFQRAMHEFDVAFQLDKDKFAEDTRRFNQTFGITQAGLTGMYGGQATLPALTSYANQFGTWGSPYNALAATDPRAQALIAQNPSLGDPAYQQQLLQARGYVFYPGEAPQTLAAQQQNYAQQMGIIGQAASLQANPFRQQQAIGQMSGLLGGQGVAGFQAPNVVQGVGTAGGNTGGGMGYLRQMIDDIRDPTANQTSMNQVLQGIPTPNKLNSTEFLRAAPSTQSMVLQGMQEKFGLDPGDALKQIQQTLPQFQAPSTLGGLRR